MMLHTTISHDCKSTIDPDQASGA